jgi:Gluconate 2-dehydrogenase subunit 3
LVTTRRREILKLLAGAAAWPLIHNDVLAALSAVHGQLGAESSLRTLNPHQNAIVESIAEIIIPETETPGAKGARVNEFIDVMLTDWADDAEKQKFLDGLAEVDHRSRGLFASDFLALAPAQQSEIVRGLDEEFLVAESRKRDRPDEPEQRGFAGLPFFSMMKRLTLIGYYTSAVGARQELHYQIIPTSHIQCAPITSQETD